MTIESTPFEIVDFGPAEYSHIIRSVTGFMVLMKMGAAYPELREIYRDARAESVFVFRLRLTSERSFVSEIGVTPLPGSNCDCDADRIVIFSKLAIEEINRATVVLTAPTPDVPVAITT